MRIAFVTPYLPWPADTGGKLRSFYLIKGLAAAHDVDLYTVAYGTRPEAGPLADLCRTVDVSLLKPAPGSTRLSRVLANNAPRSVQHFRTPESLAYVQARLARGYDLLVCDEIAVSPYVTTLPAGVRAPRVVNRQKIDYLHYAEMARERRLGREKALDWLEARRLHDFEYAEMPLYDAIAVCSAEDREEALRQAPGRPVEVIVNGADTEFFTPVRAPDPAPTLLLLGTMHYYPNIDAALYYFATMHDALRARVPGLRVLIVGHRPPPEIVALGERPGVTVTGSVPDIRPYLARSWVQAVPLRLGGGTRLKIVESMAAGLPVVSTRVGAQGLHAAAPGEHFLLADTPEEFTATAAALLHNGPARARMAHAARAFVEQHYSWARQGRRFARLCEETAARSTAHVAARASARPA